MVPLDAVVFVATEPIDMRWSFDLLAGLVRDRLGQEPRSGALFVFFGRRKDRLKALFFDRSGYCILYKRLDRGAFRLPEVVEPGATNIVIDDAEFALLLEGLELPGAQEDRAARPRRKKLH